MNYCVGLMCVIYVYLNYVNIHVYFCNQLMKLNSMYKNKMHENVEFNSLLNSTFYHIHPPA